MVTKHLFNKVVATLKNEASSTAEILAIIILATAYDTLWEVRKFMQKAKYVDEDGSLLTLVHTSTQGIKDMLNEFANDVLVGFSGEELDENPFNLKDKRLDNSQKKTSLYMNTIGDVVSRIDDMCIELFNDSSIIDKCLDSISDVFISVRNHNQR